MTVVAGAGSLQSLAFAGGGNAAVEIDGQTRLPPFTAQVAGFSSQKTFALVRQQPGAASTLAFTVTDACGPWQTFVGGGGQPWQASVSGQVRRASDGLGLDGATVRVRGSTTSTVTANGGQFTLPAVGIGPVDLEVSAPGYTLVTRNVQVGVGVSSPLIIMLMMAPEQRVRVASVSAGGAYANDRSYGVSVSEDGRYIAFASEATNLVADDQNGFIDVFVKDMETGAVEVVSRPNASTQANGGSHTPAISANGRYVAFVSAATNLMPPGMAGQSDVFVKDRETGAVEPISVSISGAGVTGAGNLGGPAISADGRFVAFASAANSLTPNDTVGADIFVRDRATGTVERVSLRSDGSQGQGGSKHPRITPDGRFVVFLSTDPGLVDGDTNNAIDVFVKDRQTGLIERVNVASDGTQANGQAYEAYMTADGRFIAFDSDATSLTPGDTNGQRDVFVKDRETGSIERLSGNTYSLVGFSSDGRYIAYRNYSVWRRDRLTGVDQPIAASNSGSVFNYYENVVAMTGSGQYFAFIIDVAWIAGPNTGSPLTVYRVNTAIPFQ